MNLTITLQRAAHILFQGAVCCKIQDMEPTSNKALTEAVTRRKVETRQDQLIEGTGTDGQHSTRSQSHQSPRSQRLSVSPELEAAYKHTERALQRLLSSAIAFCDGAISAGQLKAVRELLREQEIRLAQLEGKYTPPFTNIAPPAAPGQDPEIINAPPLSEDSSKAPIAKLPESDEISEILISLERKIERLEDDYKQGRVNSSQYGAIKRHYTEQREVAIRLQQTHPDSDRWKVVLEEGKTTFLLQLNEAAVRCVAFYDAKSGKLIFTQGNIPDEADDAISLLGNFGASKFNPSSGRMLATHADDGTALVLIPGRYTSALISFSQDPPGWQVRALREVHRNFEAANKTALERGERRALVFPNLQRFVR